MNTSQTQSLEKPVSLVSCQEWASQYFADFPETPLGAVLLYQPTVARNPSDTTETSVYHYMTVVPVLSSNSGINCKVRIIPRFH